MNEKQLNVHEVKAQLSRWLNELGPEDRIVICRRNRPVAEMRLLPAAAGPRRLGLAKGEFEVSEAFFEPLPDNILDAFEGAG